jgi:DNA-binding transcriptional LysR family regulator
MVAEGYDVGIRVGQLKDSSLVARPIAPLPFVVCASPDYLRQRGQPKTLADLGPHNCLRLSRTSSQDTMPWFLAGNQGASDKTIAGSLLINDFSALVQAAVQGLGLVCVPLPLVLPLFRAGQLRPVLTDLIRSDLVVYLYYPNRQNLPTRTRSFVDYVLEHLQAEDDLQLPATQLVAPFVR